MDNILVNNFIRVMDNILIDEKSILSRYINHHITLRREGYEMGICDDCEGYYWYDPSLNDHKLDACADNYCCFKYCCPDGCNRTLKCGHKIHTHSTFVEGPEALVTCKECGKKETIYYMWYGLSMAEHRKKYGD